MFVDEDTSGRALAFAERPAGYRLLHTIDRGDHVFFSKIDRLSRRTVDSLATIDIFRQKGVAVHVVDFGGSPLDLTNAMGFAMVAMQAAFAEVEGKKIGEPTREALKYRRDRGMPVNAHSPYGMRRKKRRRSSGGYQAYDEWDSQECQEIREIYRRVRENGEHLYRVAIDFAKQGRMTAKGKPWARPPKRAGGVWRDCRVRRTFHWYCCLRELGLDIETMPVAIAAVFSSAWRKARTPRNIKQWYVADPEGLQEYVELAKRGAAQSSR